MANDSTFIQNAYYHYILSEPSLAMRFEPDFFSAKSVQIAFRIAKDYVVKYHEAPTGEQMKELVRINNLEDQLKDDIIDALYAQKKLLNNFTEEWLYDEVTNWAIIENVKKAIVEAAAYLKLNKENMETGKAKEIVEHIKTMFNRTCVLEFTDEVDHGSDFWDAESHKQNKLKRSPTGYDFIDMCLNGGRFEGCLECYVGAPKIGKSLWMQNLCAESVKKGENCAYISLELPKEMITARIGANMFSIPSLEYERYASDIIAFREKIRTFRSGCFIEPGELLIQDYPTSALTVIELESFLLQEEERRSTPDKPFKFKNIFIDYLNIMRNYRNPNSENTYMKIKQLAEDLKAMGKKNGWAIITATQTNRSQFDTNDITANQVSESSALGATVDIMFGIISDPLMKAQGKYYLKCIYDRVSPQENKKKLYDCNFNYLRLTENMEEGVIEVSMMPNFANYTGEKFVKEQGVSNAKKAKQVFQDGQYEPNRMPHNPNFDKPAQQESPENSTDLFNPAAVPAPPNPNISPLINITGTGIF